MRVGWPNRPLVSVLVGGPKLHLIEQVEGFDAQLSSHAATERDIAAHGKIELAHCETADGIAPERSLKKRISIRIERRRCERCAIEPPASGNGVVFLVERHA